jgi:glycosyltransferase involved in cell wall biosynthesis
MLNHSVPIRVLYDHQIFTWQNYGGISRYFADLLKAFHLDPAYSPHLALRYSDNAYLRELPELGNDILPKSDYRAPLSYRLLGRKRARHSPARINLNHSRATLERGEYDLFHPTYYDPYFFDLLSGKPFVLTVYDMIHELFPEHYCGQNPFKEKEILIHRANHILAISHSTKKDLMEIYRVPSSKVSVVHLGSDFSPKAHRPTHLALPDKYVLYVGTRVVYKNCYFMWRALRDVLVANPGLHIICAGGDPFVWHEIDLLSSLGISDRVLYHEASTSSLITLYQRATALVFPSLYEGFGLPMVEAFNCGCPVLASRSPALEEIGGDAALYFEPKSISSLQQAVDRILHDGETCDSLRRLGSLRGKDFSPARCAQETGKIYANILGRR